MVALVLTGVIDRSGGIVLALVDGAIVGAFAVAQATGVVGSDNKTLVAA